MLYYARTFSWSETCHFLEYGLLQTDIYFIDPTAVKISILIIFGLKPGPGPGVVIIDYRLPSMSGLQVMREALTIEPSSKVIFVSGDDSIEQERVDIGATVFLKKPTSIKMITDTVTRPMNF